MARDRRDDESDARKTHGVKHRGNWRRRVDEALAFDKLTRIDWAVRAEIVRTLTEVKGNRSKAAKLLGCSRETLFRYIGVFKIEREEYMLNDRVIIINLRQPEVARSCLSYLTP